MIIFAHGIKPKITMENGVIINKRGFGKTLKKWAPLGFVPKRGRKGELRYCNRGDIAKGKAPQLYFDPEDVKEDKKFRLKSLLLHEAHNGTLIAIDSYHHIDMTLPQSSQ